LRELQDFLNGTGVWRVLAGIHYSKLTNKFQFDSDSMNIRATELFPFAQYGGSYTGSYHQADDKFFNFYSVKAVPTFYKNTTLYPDIETNNIAISADGNKYDVLDQTDLDRCMDTPSICNSHSPIQTFSNQALCVVTTYSSNSPTCPLKTFHTQPFVFLHFESFNHVMFYSTPNHSNIFVRCAKSNGTIEDHDYQIFGIGTAKF